MASASGRNETWPIVSSVNNPISVTHKTLPSESRIYSSKFSLNSYILMFVSFVYKADRGREVYHSI